jgi:hypothetical protein
MEEWDSEELPVYAGPDPESCLPCATANRTDDGQTFTFAEIGQWLKEAGFTEPGRLEAGGVSPLILATKP